MIDMIRSLIECFRVLFDLLQQGELINEQIFETILTGYGLPRVVDVAKTKFAIPQEVVENLKILANDAIAASE